MAGALRLRLADAEAAALTASPRAVLSTAAALAAAVLALFSVGTWPVMAVLLGVAAWERVGAVAAVLAAASTMLRLGSTSVGAAAGMQSVFGPAVFVRPVVAGVSAGLAGAALVLAPRTRRAALPFGLVAALVMAGPSGATAAGLLVRAVAAVACVELAWAAAGRWAGWAPYRHGVVVGAAAAGFALAVVGRPAGVTLPASWGDVVRAVAVVAAAGGVVAAATALLRRRGVESVDA